jgi:hypothetical protein
VRLLTALLGSRRFFVTVPLLAVASFAVVYAVYPAFSGSVSVRGNTFSAGTVAVGDNDSGSALWTVTNAKPGDIASACIKVTYTGTLPATVRLYVSASSGALGQYLSFTAETVSFASPPAFPSCTGYTLRSTLSTGGTLASFVTARTGYTDGIEAFPPSQTRWNQNDAVYYRFTATLQSNPAAQGQSETATFAWEAREQ